MGLVFLTAGALLAAPAGALPARAVRQSHRYDGWVSVEPRRWPSSTQTQQATVPLPPQRRPGLANPAQETATCVVSLAQAGISARAGTVPPAPQGSSCGIDDPVNLVSVRSDPGEVKILGEPLLACDTARVFGGFLRDLAAPLAKGDFGSPLTAVSVGGGYECRPRNHVAGAKPSAHGRGLAIDVMGFALSDGRKLTVAADHDTPFLRAFRVAACGFFTTVLGPGADAEHGNHLHLDLEKHGSSDRYRICE